MQNLESVAQQLGKIAAAFREGGLYLLIAVIAFLAYLVIMAALKRKRQATQEVNVNLPPANGTNGNGHSPALIREHEGRIAKAEGGLETLNRSFETFRTENRQDHQQIFNAISNLKP